MIFGLPVLCTGAIICGISGTGRRNIYAMKKNSVRVCKCLSVVGEACNEVFGY
jgi:hypothetical protein